MVKVILALGAHPDDIESGAGATLTKLVRSGDRLVCVVFSDCTDVPQNKDIQDEFKDSMSFLTDDSYLLSFPNRHLPEYSGDIRRHIEAARDTVKPDLVFTHSPGDVHQDHRTIYEETVRVIRNRTVLGYESPQSTLEFSPDVYYRVDERDVENKLSMLECYDTQRHRGYFNPDKTEGTLRYNGRKLGFEYAECFELIRDVHL